MSPERIQRGLLTLGIVLGTYGIAQAVVPDFAVPLTIFAALWSSLAVLRRWARTLAVASQLLAAVLYLGLNAHLWILTGHPHALPGAVVNGLLFMLCLYLLRREEAYMVSLSIPLLLLAAPTGFSWFGHLGAQPLALPALGHALVAIMWIRSLALSPEDLDRLNDPSHLRESHFLVILFGVLIAAPTDGPWLHLGILLLFFSLALGMWRGAARSTRTSRSWGVLGLVPLLALFVFALPSISVRLVEQVEQIEWPTADATDSGDRPEAVAESDSSPSLDDLALPVPSSGYITPEDSPIDVAEALGSAAPTTKWRKAEEGEVAQAYLDSPVGEQLTEPLGDRSILSRADLPDLPDLVADIPLPTEHNRPGRALSVPVVENSLSIREPELGVHVPPIAEMPPRGDPLLPQSSSGEAPPLPREKMQVDSFEPESLVADAEPGDRADGTRRSQSLPEDAPPPTSRTSSVGVGDDRLDYGENDRIELSGSGFPVGELVVPPRVRPPKSIYLRSATYAHLNAYGLRPASPATAGPPFPLSRQSGRDSWWTLRLKNPPSTSIPLPSAFSEIAVSPSVELFWDARNYRIELPTTLPQVEVRFNHPRFGDEVSAMPNEDLSPFLALFGDETVDNRLRAISREIARSSRLAPARFARRAVAYLQRHADYSLSAEIPPGPAPALVRWLEHQSDGYCEHFAGAFVLLARAQGIPARAVSGYLISDFEPSQRRFLIYSSDAHAWAEIWIDGEWHRVEATPPANLRLAREQGGQFADFTLDSEPVTADPLPIPPPPLPDVASEDTSESLAEPVPEEPVDLLASIEKEIAGAVETAPIEVEKPELPFPPDPVEIAVTLPPPVEAEEPLIVETTVIPPAEAPTPAHASPVEDVVAPPPAVALSDEPGAPPRWRSWPLLAAAASLLIFALAAFFGRSSRVPGQAHATPVDPTRIKAGKLLHTVERWSAQPGRPVESTADLRRELTRLRYGKNPDPTQLRLVRKKWDAVRGAKVRGGDAPTSLPGAGKESSSLRA